MTSMEKEIHYLIFNQLQKTKRLDTSFINDLIYIYLSHKNMEGYIKDTVGEMNLNQYSNYAGAEGTAVAAFNPIDRKIFYSKEGLGELNRHLNETYSYGFTHDGMTLLLSLYVTQFILHELEHAYQHRQIKRKVDTLEGKLLTATKPFETTQDFIKQNYNSSLAERLAQIRSLTTINNIINEEDLHENFYTIFNSNLIKERLRGFSFDDYLYFSKGPTFEYMDQLIKEGFSEEEALYLYQKDKEKALRELYEQYTTDERIDFGLPILRQEYDQLDSKIRRK